MFCVVSKVLPGHNSGILDVTSLVSRVLLSGCLGVLTLLAGCLGVLVGL